MNQLKVVFPFLAALGVYFLALNSPMYQQMNQPHSVENEIKSIPVEKFNRLSENGFFNFSSFIGFNPPKIPVFFLRNCKWIKELHKPSLLTFGLRFLLLIRE